MIIQSLCQYYDILDNDPDVEISRPGHTNARVSFGIVIDNDGNLKNIIDLRSDEKKPRPRMMNVPLQESRSGKNPPPYFLCDNAKYVFGVEKLKKSEFKKKYNSPSKKIDEDSFKILEDGEKEIILINESTLSRLNSFKDMHNSILEKSDDKSAIALMKFINNWNPEKFREVSKTEEYKDRILDGANFVFFHDTSYIHEKGAVKKIWANHLLNENDSSDCFKSQCLITGNYEPIAKIHQKIKKVRGAQPAGASIVSFNDDSFISYDKKQSYNAPVGETSMFKYTTVLNHLLADPKHSLTIADSTVVYWAETSEGAYEDLVKSFFSPPVEEKEDDKSKKKIDSERIRDKKYLLLIKDILNKVRKGYYLEESDLGIKPETKFYILGLSPNNARISIRFWYMDNFGSFVSRIAQHHIDMNIEKSDFDPAFVSIYRLLWETTPKESKNTDPSPILGGLMMRAIINNLPYPVQMYNAILNRVKVERSINSTKAGFIKAYLLRSARAGSSYLNEDLITVSLNEESQDVPYRLGRLFAVLEKVQGDTNKGIGSTINSKYFSSASTTPAVVFPVLIKLAQHHIAKSDWGFKVTKDIEDVLSEVDQFPRSMNLEEQGMFMLGYYHQKKANYRKKEEKEEVKEA